MSSTHPYAAYHLASVPENEHTYLPPPDLRPTAPRPPGVNSPAPRKHYFPLLFFACCIFPPVLSLVHLVIGHAILRYPPPILSSVEAGATGGSILSLPIALLHYLLSTARKPPGPPLTSPENFFEDDDSNPGILGRPNLKRCGRPVFFILLVLSIGTIAGPLGVTVLASNQNFRVLNPAQAATAGIVGSAVLLGGLSLLAGAAFLLRVCWIRQSTPLWPARD